MKPQTEKSAVGPSGVKFRRHYLPCLLFLPIWIPKLYFTSLQQYCIFLIIIHFVIYYTFIPFSIIYAVVLYFLFLNCLAFEEKCNAYAFPPAKMKEKLLCSWFKRILLSFDQISEFIEMNLNDCNTIYISKYHIFAWLKYWIYKPNSVLWYSGVNTLTAVVPPDFTSLKLKILYMSYYRNSLSRRNYVGNTASLFFFFLFSQNQTSLYNVTLYIIWRKIFWYENHVLDMMPPVLTVTIGEFSFTAVV